VLFLSRIEPKSLLLRFDFAGMTVLQLQQMLLQAVRDEYDHNVSQQIYVSKESWVLVVNARESLTQLINTCASQLNAQSDAMELANLVLAAYASNSQTPIDLALNYIKNEMKQY
jgi:selenocysteine lyase/cysteine desulfurase